jgi:type IV pilus assembly protein PilC
MTKTGRQVRGAVFANDEVHLSKQLESANMELLACKRVRYGAHAAISKYISRVSTRDLIQFFVQMEQLQSAGIGMLESIKNAREASVSPRIHDVLLDVHRNVNDGQALSEAMAHHRDVFDNLCTSIVASGEKTGDMPTAYRYLIAHLKWADDMKRRVRKATRYPLVVITAVLIAVIIMMAFVVPQITQFFSFLGEGKELPLATVTLIAASGFFQQYWWAMIGGIAAGAGILLAGRRASEKFAYKTDDILLNMPVFGPLVRKLNIARFVQTVSALYAAAIPFLDAIATARTTINNRVLGAAVDEVLADMQAGKPFSQALTAAGEFPPMVPLLISTGEETGKMSEVLSQIAEFYNADVDEEVQKMITMIEPALTAILGGIILWIAVGVFGPIYELFEDLDI